MQSCDRRPAAAAERPVGCRLGLPALTSSQRACCC